MRDRAWWASWGSHHFGNFASLADGTPAESVKTFVAEDAGHGPWHLLHTKLMFYSRWALGGVRASQLEGNDLRREMLFAQFSSGALFHRWRAAWHSIPSPGLAPLGDERVQGSFPINDMEPNHHGLPLSSQPQTGPPLNFFYHPHPRSLPACLQ